MRIAAASLVLVALLASASALAATAENPQYRPNPADTRAARASTLRLGDLGAGWTGGLKPAGKPQGLSCASYKAKQSDLVVTGLAEAQFTSSGVNVDSQIQVLKTPEMVRLDFQRTVRPEVVRCYGAQFEQAAGAGTKVVSTKPLPFPRLGSVSAAYRILADVTAQGTTVRLLVDVIAVGVRRTEISLVVMAPVQAKAPVAALEKRLGRVLAGRALP
jgi:hypothetical protein